MAQRISRAKGRIVASGEPFRLPTAAERPVRIGSVLPVLYLIFNEGYASSTGPELPRTDLSEAAIRLGRMFRDAPDDPEATGLPALRADRRPRRSDRCEWDLVPLAQQDRTPGTAPSRRGTPSSTGIGSGRVGGGQIRRDRGHPRPDASAKETDWPQILALYGLLEQMTGNPVVTLNRAARPPWPTARRWASRSATVEDRLAGPPPTSARHRAEMAGDTDARSQLPPRSRPDTTSPNSDTSPCRRPGQGRRCRPAHTARGRDRSQRRDDGLDDEDHPAEAVRGDRKRLTTTHW